MAKPTAEEIAARASQRAKTGVEGTPTIVTPAAASITPPGTTVEGAPSPNLGRTEDILPTVKTSETTTPESTEVIPPAPTDTGVPEFLFPAQTVAPVVTALAADAPAEGLSEQQKVNFSSLRRAKEEAEKKLSEVFDDQGNVRNEFVKTLNIEAPNVGQLRKERDEALDRLAKVDLQSDPRWQSKYQTAENIAKGSINRIAKEYDIDAAAVQAALALPLKERINYFNKNLPDALPLIAPHLAKLDEIQEQKAIDIQNASQVREQDRQQFTAAREQAIRQVRETLHSQVTRELEDAGYFPFKSIPGNVEWNRGVESVKTRVMELLNSNDPVIQSRALALGAVAPVLLRTVQIANIKIKELTKQLKLHGGLDATIQTSTGGPSAPAPVDTSKMSPQELAHLNIMEARAKRGQ